MIIPFNNNIEKKHYKLYGSNQMVEYRQTTKYIKMGRYVFIFYDYKDFEYEEDKEASEYINNMIFQKNNDSLKYLVCIEDKIDFIKYLMLFGFDVEDIPEHYLSTIIAGDYINTFTIETSVNRKILTVLELKDSITIDKILKSNNKESIMKTVKKVLDGLVSMMRVDDKRAQKMVTKCGWTYCSKSDWRDYQGIKKGS